MEILAAAVWRARAASHERHVDAWIQPHLERRGQGRDHPVHDFLFTYYSQRPAPSTRHDWPLRLGATGTDVVESHRISCSHFARSDASRSCPPSWWRTASSWRGASGSWT